MQTTTKIVTRSDTEITLEVRVDADDFAKERKPSLKKLGKSLELKGFRKGHVPEDVLTTHIGEGQLLQEMAHSTINTAFPGIVKEHNLRIIGRPSITVTKLARGNPLEFKITAVILPEVVLPDYKALAARHNGKKQKTVAVSDEELQQAIDDIRKRVAIADQQQTTNNRQQEKEEALPELTDELVKKLGLYENVTDFKEQLRKQIQQHKEHTAREKHRLTIIDDIVQKANPNIPDILIDAELGKMLAQMRADIDRIGMKPEDYYKQIGKTEDDLRKEWRSDAEKRAKIQLVLNAIAEKENIRADEKEVEGQTRAILAQHPNTNPKTGGTRQVHPNKEQEMATRIYVATMLANEKVFEFLEKQTGENNS